MVSFSFHDLLTITIQDGSDRRFVKLLREEFPNFLVDRLSPSRRDPLGGGAPDIEILFGPFDHQKIGGPWAPFFEWSYGPDSVFGVKRYKTGRWKLAVIGLNQPTTRLYFGGNRSSLIFFIGGVLEPIMRYKLAGKGGVLIHSSAVATSAGGILISGIRHTGKTLVMLRSVLLGAGLLSDDYTFVSTNGSLYSYPKKVNFFTTHFREIPELHPFWKGLPISHQITMRISWLIRRITRDYVVLGYQRFLSDLIPSVSIVPQAPLSKIILLTRRPADEFSIRRGLLPSETVAKLVANNQWEGSDFQKILVACRYGNPDISAENWLERETKAINRFVKDVPASEWVIPDFSKENLSRYLRAVEEEVLK